MKKSVLAGLFLAGIFLLSAPPAAAQTKEIPADGNIPLTSEYFPDEWFLNGFAKYQDKNKDGHLSPEEIAAVTNLWITGDLSDFSQICYFTNLRELTAEPADEDSHYDIWLGDKLDLTMLPDLENVRLLLDSRKAPASASDVQIKVSGLEHLKSFCVSDRAAEADSGGGRPDVRTGVIDFRNTPTLESVYVSDAKGVLFDDRNRISLLWLNNVTQIPADRICRFEKLENLRLQADIPDMTYINLSECSLLTELSLKNDYLQTVETAGADALKIVEIQSVALKNIDLSQNPALTKLVLECPQLTDFVLGGSVGTVSIKSDVLSAFEPSESQSLKNLSLICPCLETCIVSGISSLEVLSVESDALADIALSANQNLKRLSLTCLNLGTLNVRANIALEYLDIKADRLKELDVTKNTKLQGLYIRSEKLTRLNLKKNKKLDELSVNCEKLGALDLSANRKLRALSMDGTPLKSLNLSKQPDLTAFSFQNNKKLKKLDLSKNRKISDLKVQNTALNSLNVSKLARLYWLEVTGNKKLTALDLSKNKRLSYADVSNNALKTLRFGSKVNISYLNCSGNRLTSLDLSKAIYLTELVCDKKLKVKGYKGKIKKI